MLILVNIFTAISAIWAMHSCKNEINVIIFYYEKFIFSITTCYISTEMCSSNKVLWWITKLSVIAWKKYLSLEIKTITNFLLLKMKYITDGFFFVWLLTHTLPLLSQCVNEVIHLLLNCLYYFFLSIKLLLFDAFWIL